MGAATRDDLVFTQDDALSMLARGVVLEEKVDGANLGISFGSEDGPPRCQKRGHWITASSEQQFSKLESWLSSHQDSLRKALGTRYILYGEWLAARHSVPYNALPDWFLAYDVYDKQSARFLSSRRRDALLRGTGVRTVPSVAPAPGRAFTGPGALEDVRQLVLALRSRLCVPGSSQWAEGVYVRLEEGDWVVGRAKLVHPAFRQAIEGDGACEGGSSGSGGGVHWSKRATEWNRLRPDLWQQQPEEDESETEAQETGPEAGAEETGRLDAAVTGPEAPPPAEQLGTRQQPGDDTKSSQRPVRQAAAKEVEIGLTGGDTGAGGGAPAAPALRRRPPPPSLLSTDVSGAADLSAARVRLGCGGLYVALVGGAVDAVAAGLVGSGCVPAGHAANRVLRDGPHHHITLVTPPEMQQLQEQYGMEPQDVLDRILAEVDPSGGAWVPLGLGRARAASSSSSSSSSSTPAGPQGGGGPSAAGGGGPAEALFLVVSWPAGRCARAALGLAREQHFHVTLGFNPHDLHDVPKDLSALVGGRVDPQLVGRLAAVAESAGARFSASQRAAVLVLQALTELDLTSEGASQPAAAAATAPAPGPAPGAAGVAGPPGRSLTPAVIDCLHTLLDLALAWTSDPTSPPTGPSHQAASTSACAGAPAGRASPSSSPSPAGTAATSRSNPESFGSLGVAHAPEQVATEQSEERRRRHFVAACAHVALARLAGRCGELEEVCGHVREAEARLDAAEEAAAGAGDSGGGADGSGTAAVLAGRSGGELEVLAAAACLAGKALCRLERYGEAAVQLERAAELVEAAGLPDASAAAAGGPDLAALLLSAVRPTLDASALRTAASKCARRAAAAAAAAASADTSGASAAATSDAGRAPAHPSASSSSAEHSTVAGSGAHRAQVQAHGATSAVPHDCEEDGSDDRRPGGAAEWAPTEPGVAMALAGMPYVPCAAGVVLNPRDRAVVRGVRVRGSGGECREADVTLMRNTSWVVPGVLAASSTPKSLEQIAALGQLGIGLVVTLTEEEPLPPDWFATQPAATPSPAGAGGAGGGSSRVRAAAPAASSSAAAVYNLFVPVPNYEPPSVDQMDLILAALEDHFHYWASAAGNAVTTGIGGSSDSGVSGAAGSCGIAETRPPGARSRPGVLIHCGGGKGRAGTALACYLCKHGQAPPLVSGPGAGAGCEAAASEALAAGSGGRGPALSADAAVRLVRELRPGSIETEQQRRFVGRYCDELWRRYDRAAAAAAAETGEAAAAVGAPAAAAASRDISPNAQTGVEHQGAGQVVAGRGPHDTVAAAATSASGPAAMAAAPATAGGPAAVGAAPAPAAAVAAPAGVAAGSSGAVAATQRAAQGSQRARPVKGLPRLAVLVGLPGSGKSTFARALEASGSWSRICPDDCGSRGAAEAAFGAAMLRGPAAGWKAHVVLDRCSPDEADRRAWLDLGLIGRRDKGIVAVFFDVPPPVCKARVAARQDHPTIRPGRGGRIVDDFAARLQPPTTAEGFERVYVVRSREEAEALLAAWGAGGLMQIDTDERAAA